MNQAPPADLVPSGAPPPQESAAGSAPQEPGAAAGPPRSIRRSSMAMRKLDRRAAALGFKSAADMIAALEAAGSSAHTPATPAKQEPLVSQNPIAGSSGAPIDSAGAAPAPQPTPTPSQPATAPQPGASHRRAEADAAAAASRALPEHTRRRIQREKEEMRKRAAELEQERNSYRDRHTAAERTLAVQREEEAIKLDLVRAGVQDLDGAWYFFTNELKQLRADTSPEGVEKLKAFLAAGGAGWAQGIRASRGYLFGTTTAPANTGAPTLQQSQAPGSPKPGTVTGQAAEAGGKFDFRTASPEEAKKRLASFGVTHSFGRSR